VRSRNSRSYIIAKGLGDRQRMQVSSYNHSVLASRLVVSDQSSVLASRLVVSDQP
jgi:hypothetical protein